MDSSQELNGMADDEVLIVPTDLNDRIAFLKYEGRNIATKFAIRCKVQKNGTRRADKPPLNQKETRDLIALLCGIADIDDFTPEMIQATYLRRMLEVITNQTTDGMIFEFPPEAVEIATKVYDRFASEGWGARAANVIADEDDNNDQQTGLPPPVPTAASQNLRTYAKRAPPNHAIYGTEGIMRGILVKRGAKAISYELDPQFPRPRSHKAFGHNGLQVGDWWPMQICVLRDGAHGARIGGIAGTLDEGAWSIVVSGTYSGLDKDEGNRLYYSGSDSHDNTDPRTPRISRNTMTMQASRQRGRLVRVIRSAGSEWKGAPEKGLRYDGLYRITEENIRKNDKGGAYIRFTLERDPIQPAIVTTRPTAAELRAFSRVRDYY